MQSRSSGIRQVSPILAGVLAWRQITKVAERAFFRVFRNLIFFLLVRAIANRLTKPAIKAFKFPRIDDQVVRLKIVVFANQIALIPFRILRAFSVSWFKRSQGRNPETLYGNDLKDYKHLQVVVICTRACLLLSRRLNLFQTVYNRLEILAASTLTMISMPRQESRYECRSRQLRGLYSCDRLARHFQRPLRSTFTF